MMINISVKKTSTGVSEFFRGYLDMRYLPMWFEWLTAVDQGRSKLTIFTNFNRLVDTNQSKAWAIHNIQFGLHQG